VAISYVNSATAQSFPTTGSALSTTITPSAVGNLICVSAFLSDITVTMSISDNGATPITWLNIIPLTNAAGGSSVYQAWYGHATGTSLITITVALSSGNFNLEFVVDQFTGTGTSTALDQSVTTSTGASTVLVSAGPIRPTYNGELIYAVANGGAITGVGTGYTQAQSFDIIKTEYQVPALGAGDAFNGTFVTNAGGSNYRLIFAAFKGPGPTLATVPTGVALTTPAFQAKFLYFDTGDYSTGL
jgi:hypothetical protein